MLTLMGILRLSISAYFCRMSQGADTFRKLVFWSTEFCRGKSKSKSKSW